MTGADAAPLDADAWEDARRHGDPGPEPVPAIALPVPQTDAWDDVEPIAFGETVPPNWPAGVFSPEDEAFIKEVACFTQTPLDFSGALLLAVLSVAWAGKVVVEVYEGYVEALMLYVAIAAATGERKSAVYGFLEQPIRQYERQAIKGIQPEIAEYETKRDFLERKYAELTATPRGKRAASKKETADNKKTAEKKEPPAAQKAPEEMALLTPEQRMAQAIEIKNTLAELHPPTDPTLLVGDINAEALEQLMSGTGGKVAIFCPEGGIVFDQMAGLLRDKATNVTVYLQGYTGEPHTVRRVSRINIIDRPALTIGLMTQPATLRKLSEKEDLLNRGVIGRLLFSCPASSNIGFLKPTMPAIFRPVLLGYEKRIGRMLEAPLSDPPELMRFSEEAVQEFTRYFEKIELRRRPGGDLAQVPEWAAKLRGNIVRIAALLHLADNWDHPCPWELPVSASAFMRAEKLSDYLIDHARAAFGLMQESESSGRARKLLKWIREKKQPQFTARDAQRFLSVTGKREDVLDPALRILESHGYIKGERIKNSDRYTVSRWEICKWQKTA